MNVLNKGNLGRRILKRLLSLIIVVWGVVTLSFCLQVFTGTDPAEMIVLVQLAATGAAAFRIYCKQRK